MTGAQKERMSFAAPSSSGSEALEELSTKAYQVRPGLLAPSSPAGGTVREDPPPLFWL